MYIFLSDQSELNVGGSLIHCSEAVMVDSVEERSDEPAQGKALLVRGLQEMPNIRSMAFVAIWCYERPGR